MKHLRLLRSELDTMLPSGRQTTTAGEEIQRLTLCAHRALRILHDVEAEREVERIQFAELQAKVSRLSILNNRTLKTAMGQALATTNIELKEAEHKPPSVFARMSNAAEYGTPVRFDGCGGYPDDKRLAIGILKLGMTYLVQETRSNDRYGTAAVKLQGFDGWFSSALFAKVT